jgi:hypothetical protein
MTPQERDMVAVLLTCVALAGLVGLLLYVVVGR